MVFQPGSQDLIAAVQVAQVRAGVIPAGIAGTARVDGAQIRLMGSVSDVDDARGGEQMAIARVSRGHHAVEHIDAP